jgi:hypothetical protein
LATALGPHTHQDQIAPLERRSFRRALQWDADLPPDLVERMWTEPQALLAEGQKLQDKLRCTVARIEHAAGLFTWKHHNWGTVRRTAKKCLAQSPARKSWHDSSYLRAAGIPTPRVRAVLEHQIGPLQHCSYLLTDYIVGTSLYRLMRFGCPTPDFVGQLAEQVATIWQQLDDLGVWHNDFKTENFLVDRAGKVWLIDFERMRRFGTSDRDRLRERQIKDARDLLHPRNWRSRPEAAEVFREAILATPAARQTLSGPLAKKHPLAKPTASSNHPDHLVTVLITCHNAADTIVGCLESVRDMADEILVADFGSTDDTIERVSAFGGCRIVEPSSLPTVNHRADHVADLVTWAAQQAKHEWILRLRPDEQLNGELSRQIQDLLASEPKQDGFEISRTVYLHGKRLRFGNFRSEPAIRLFRKSASRFELRDGRVEVGIPSERIGTVKSRLVYEACPSIERCVRDMMRAATRAAEDSLQKGHHASHRALLWRVTLSFFRSYVLRWGWLDGSAGLHASFLAALSSYFRSAIHSEMERPASTRRTLVDDHWSQLKVFAADDTVGSNAKTPAVRAAA